MEQTEYLRLVRDVLDTLTVQELKKCILASAERKDKLEISSFVNELREYGKTEHTEYLQMQIRRETVDNLWDQAEAFMDDWNSRHTKPLSVRFSINEEYDDWSNSNENEFIVQDPYRLSHDFGFMMYLLERALIFRQTDIAEKLAATLCSADIRDVGGHKNNRKILCEMENNWFVPLDGFSKAIEEVCFLILNQKAAPAEERIQRIAPMLIRYEYPVSLLSSYAELYISDPEDVDQVLTAALEAVENDPLYEVLRTDRSITEHLTKNIITHLSDHKQISEILLNHLPSDSSLFSYYFRNRTDNWDPAEEICLIQNCLVHLEKESDIKLAYRLLDKLSKHINVDEVSQAKHNFAARPGISAYAKYICLNSEGFDHDQLAAILSETGSMEKMVYFLLEGDRETFYSALQEINEEPLDSLPLTALLLGYLYEPEKGQDYPDCLIYLLNISLIDSMKKRESYQPVTDEHRYDFLSDDAEENVEYLLERMRRRLPLTADQRFMLIYAVMVAVREFCIDRIYREGPERFIEPAAFIAALDLATRPFTDSSQHISPEKIAGDLMTYEPALRREIEDWLEEDES